MQDLQNPTITRLTPLEQTDLFNQPSSARWLINYGVRPDTVPLWHLG